MKQVFDSLKDVPTGMKYSLAIVLQIAILVLNRSHIDVLDYVAIEPGDLSLGLKIIYWVEMWGYLIARLSVEAILIYAMALSLNSLISHIKRDPTDRSSERNNTNG
ncbi:hypothetical protein F4X73_19100 [Candidatus Poribacteria bacterium]|nr:hypothetical protein [Candidatus Poribacteria bacterium]